MTKNEKQKIGIVNHESMNSEFIVYSLLGHPRFSPIVVPSSNKQVEFIKAQKVAGLVVAMPRFTERNYRSLVQIASLVNDIPIVVVSEDLERVVQLNLGFIGRIGHANFNDGLSEIPEILDQLLNQTQIITRRYLRHPTKSVTKFSVQDKPINAVLMDVSVGGAKVQAPRNSLEIQQEFMIGIPRGTANPLLVNARVIRIEEPTAGYGDTFQAYGIQFTSLVSLKAA